MQFQWNSIREEAFIFYRFTISSYLSIHLQVSFIFCRFKLSLRMIISFFSFFALSHSLTRMLRTLFIYYYYGSLLNRPRGIRGKKKSLVLWNDYPAVCVFFMERALNTNLCPPSAASLLVCLPFLILLAAQRLWRCMELFAKFFLSLFVRR